MGTIDESWIAEIDKRTQQLESHIKELNETIETLKLEISLLKANQHVDSISDFPTDVHRSTKRTSIREFLDTKNIKGHYDLAVSIAYFKEIIEGVTPLTVKALEDGYREAKEALPKNLSDTIYRNTKRGFIMESKNSASMKKMRAWELTNKGIKHVEDSLARKDE